MGSFLKELDEIHRRELATSVDAEHRATLAEDKVPLLKDNTEFNAVVENVYVL